MVYLTKKIHFSASHALKNSKWAGHNYVLEVTVRGRPDEKRGALPDFEKITQKIEKKILSHVNYKHLERASPFLEGKNPTAENLVRAFWKQLEEEFPKGALYEIKLQQADSETVIYRGE
ncbi:MAG: 6-carboxytetrahydropterin synthase [Candidatus Omnitrophica bacterium]|nr:6-carboxytetrahydropterin synthase [Candidatus Omnitrophota bacterium]